jgi:vancomycin resistance protein YoaR
LRKNVLALVLAAAALAAFAFGFAPARVAFQRFSVPPWDAALENAEIPRSPGLESWLRGRARLFGERHADLLADADMVPVTFADLGLSLDVAATAARIRGLAREPSALERWRRVWSGPLLRLDEVAPVIAFDRERAAALLARLVRELRRAPENARLDLAQHRRVSAVEGRELDVGASLAVLELGPRREDSAFPLVFERIVPAIRDEALPPVDVSQVLGAYETSFRGRAGPRAVNIRRAAGFLDRVVIAPGGVFSFNRTVGPRVEERGFVKAPVIVHDETEPGLGGGVCQVATTLHAAAVFAGLEVIERRSHSRASGYAPLGLDATVIDGKVDLRFRNPFDTAVMIHAALSARSAISVEILGRAPLGKVDHAYAVVERHAFYRRIVEKAELTAGSFELKQKGSYGYDIMSVVSSTSSDGRVERRRYRSKYYPVPEVFWVGRGTDAALLPALPDGALGLEPPSTAIE